MNSERKAGFKSIIFFLAASNAAILGCSGQITSIDNPQPTQTSNQSDSQQPTEAPKKSTEIIPTLYNGRFGPTWDVFPDERYIDLVDLRGNKWFSIKEYEGSITVKLPIYGSGLKEKATEVRNPALLYNIDHFGGSTAIDLLISTFDWIDRSLPGQFSISQNLKIEGDFMYFEFADMTIVDTNWALVLRKDIFEESSLNPGAIARVFPVLRFTTRQNLQRRIS